MRLSEFKLAAGDFGTFGQGLQRPECVWVDRDGVWASDARGGVARVKKDADPDVLGSGIADPNGFSRRPDGSFIVAGIGDGGLHVISPGGQTRKLLDSFDGKPLGTVNYACADGPERIWLSVMTRKPQWSDALTSQERDGYILRVDGTRCEIVADGLDLTNEVKLSPDGRHLYAVETLGCRIVRFAIAHDGSLGAKETVGPESLGRGALPDGFAFDAMGNIWVTIINQNGLFVIDRHGDMHIVYRDMDEQAVEALAAGVEQRNGTVDHLVACASERGPLRLPTSLAFGGHTAYVGTLLLPHLATFQLPDGLA
ncbi:MAG TPA: SMP-30/gluconolactonase/LRE family protein [Rhizomicrobium sp.]|jgi:sugar lactone lactonase YvrE|nr:SMP-30/gluconolactonase/LRE family protein [Rhizomicrobium sp.]